MIFENPELEQQVTALLINWGYWSSQGMGGGAVHPMFQGGVKPQGQHSVSEDDAMKADRCIARLKRGSPYRVMLFAAYVSRLDPNTIEARTGYTIKQQRQHLEFGHRLFWMYWDAIHNGNEFALSQVKLVGD